MTGTSDARRASSTASTSCSRSENVSSTIRSAPPSSRPSICSRKAARAAAAAMGGPRGGTWSRAREACGADLACSRAIAGPPRVGEPSGPTEPPTSASRPLTSRASRASCAARRLNAPTWPSRPQAARRCRLAPNDSVSISSAPASRYSRWAAPTISGWVVTSSSRQARCGHAAAEQQRPQPAVDQERAGGETASEALSRRAGGRGLGHRSPIGSGGRAAGPEMTRPFLLGRVSKGVPLSCRRTCPDLAPCRLDAGRLSWLQRAGPSATLDKQLFSCGAMVPHAAEMSKDARADAVRRRAGPAAARGRPSASAR